MMNASSPPGEASTAPEPAPAQAPARSAVSITSRLVAGLAGIALLGVVTTFVPRALAGVAGAGLAWLVQRKRRRPYTRSVGWLGSVLATGLTFVASLVLLTVRMPAGSLDTIMQQAAQQQAQRPRPQPPAFLRQLAPGMQPNPVADSLSRQLVRSRAFTTLAIGIGGFIGAGMTGVVLGMLAWAAVTTLLYGVFARWTFGPAPPA